MQLKSHIIHETWRGQVRVRDVRVPPYYDHCLHAKLPAWLRDDDESFQVSGSIRDSGVAQSQWENLYPLRSWNGLSCDCTTAHSQCSRDRTQLRGAICVGHEPKSDVKCYDILTIDGMNNSPHRDARIGGSKAAPFVYLPYLWHLRRVV